MESFEKLGLFYLGKVFDAQRQERTEEHLLYEARDLVTHAVCVGMTGSGKTGLCLGLLEEAAIDGVPAIVIDPKGDLGNLLLSFPDLKPGDFLKWVNQDDAQRQGVSLEQYAAGQAELWRRGLAEWGQEPERIARLKESAEFAIYTPGSTAGLPVSLLSSFSAPDAGARGDVDLLRERIGTMASGLLGLVGVQEVDPIRSREHILISNILEQAWGTGQNLDLPRLIRLIESPPLTRIGVFELDSFYPAGERRKLAMLLNNLLAAPAFSAWIEGESLQLDRLLYSPSGKPRVSIFSIAHLSDAERMFFVTLLLNEVLGWMRAQPGTTSLRALLYMDEVFGFLPPVAEPPSKRAFLTLLKQARAFGLGVVLATQNPVDLDYKGLSNTGTWFIGRLQTERDKERLLAGLSTATASVDSNVDAARLSDLISRLGKRVFLMQNVHQPGPVLFQTRWTLSYLRGPLTRGQIKELMDDRRVAAPTDVQLPSAAVPFQTEPAVGPAASPVSALPQDIAQFFLDQNSRPGRSASHYSPFLFAAARVHIIDDRLGIRESSEQLCVYPVENLRGALLWEDAKPLPLALEQLVPGVPQGVNLSNLSPEVIDYLRSGNLERTYRDYLARVFQVALWKSNTFKLTSLPGESERDFRIRLMQLARERRDSELDKLRQKYVSRFDTVSRQEASAHLEVERQERQYDQQKTQVMISVGSTLLGALFGSRTRSGTIGRATTAARGAGRASRERQDIERAREKLREVQEKKARLEEQLRQEADGIAARLDVQMEVLQEITARPKKTDVLVRAAGLLWLPDLS